jgi:hypothetical protein
MQTRSFGNPNEEEQEGEHQLERLSRYQSEAVFRAFEGLNVPRAGFKPLFIWKESTTFFGEKNPITEGFHTVLE